MMTAARAGITAATYAWNEKALAPDPTNPTNWDGYGERMFRYAHFLAYRSNTVYTQLVDYANRHKEYRDLYKHVRPIYNPVSRLVNTYTAKVYGGPLDWDNMQGGAIPIVGADDALTDAIRQLWKDSRWGNRKGRFVRQGATLGDFGLWIVDDRVRGRARMEVIDPRTIAEKETDEVGNVRRVAFEEERQDDADSRPYVYRLEVDETRFATFRDGEPFAFFQDADGTGLPEWQNEYGFVPLVLGQHTDVGMQWGATAFSDFTNKIDELNDAASILNDQIRKSVNVLWFFAGVKGGTALSASAEERDEIPALYGPEGSQPFPMVAPLDLASALSNVQELLMELERDMPELALHRIRQTGNLTAPGVTAAYSDAIDRIQEAQGNYDDVLVRAHMMGISIGAFNRYPGYERFSLQSYEQGNLEHYIGERPVVADNLSKQERIQFLIQSKAPSRAAWDELDIPQETQDEWQDEADEQQALFNERMDVDQPGTRLTGQGSGGVQP